MQAQVVNNCQGPHYIQVQPQLKGNAGRLLILRPGLNLVDSKLLAEWRKGNKSFDGLFNTKIKPSKVETADPSKFGKTMLEVVGKELDDKAPLAGLPLKEALNTVELTQDTDMLAGWLEECEPTKQSDLIKAIKDRIKEITSGIAG